MNDNMKIYTAVREVPEKAKKNITGGRLKGMTDINPMWRIQTLTEQFGPCGTGWKYVVLEKKLEDGPKGERAAFVVINLYYRLEDGSWSEPIFGTGGAAFIASESNGLRISDECFKMALTDALSVACKALGMGADVYWEAGRTKYSSEPDSEPKPETKPICDRCGKPILPVSKNKKMIRTAEELIAYTKKEFKASLCYNCMNEMFKKKERRNAQ